MNEDKEIKKATELESIFRRVPKWQDLWFYQKSEVLYQMTYVFCERFLPKHGDRTVDQMVQAARSGKQNIIEGSEDGKTSTEMELKLLNVARSSIHELREDYKDYLLSRHLALWDKQHPRYAKMHDFTRAHNPDHGYQSALRLFRREMHDTRGMWQAIQDVGYKENTKVLTRAQVRVIVQFLGEP